MEGLSQEEKKSSAGSTDGVEEPSAGVGERRSVITTSSGYLEKLESGMFLLANVPLLSRICSSSLL